MSQSRTPPLVYDLRCGDCSFSRSVTGGKEAVVEVIEAHQEEQQGSNALHFVDFSAREEGGRGA